MFLTDELNGSFLTTGQLFISDADLGSFFSDVLNNPAGTVTLDWQESIVIQANLAAYWCIVDALLRRGFTKSAIDFWDRGPEFERALGIWFILQEMARRAPDLYGQKAMNATDRRTELKSVGLTINGVWQNPTTGVGLPTIGQRNNWGCGLRDWPTRF